MSGVNSSGRVTFIHKEAAVLYVYYWLRQLATLNPLPNSHRSRLVIVTFTAISNVTKSFLVVPDRRCRILRVILVRRWVTWVLGIWRGEGWGEG
jgi:hypothetical protein